MAENQFFWDASDFDWPRGPMDLGAALRDGIVGFTHKATESTNVKHVHLRETLNRAKDAGFEFIGAYHVVRSSPSAQAQAAFFLSYLDSAVPWWRTWPGFVLQIDLELWPYDKVPASVGAAFSAELGRQAPGKFRIMYASRGQYGDQLAGLGCPLWNAAYGANPAVHYPVAYPGDGSVNWRPYSGQAPVFWQYGSRLTIGTQPGCDASAFRGSVAELRQLITGHPLAPAAAQEDDMFLIHETVSGSTWLVDGVDPTGKPYLHAPTQAYVTDYQAAGMRTATVKSLNMDAWHVASTFGTPTNPQVPPAVDLAVVSAAAAAGAKQGIEGATIHVSTTGPATPAPAE